MSVGGKVAVTVRVGVAVVTPGRTPAHALARRNKLMLIARRKELTMGLEQGNVRGNFTINTLTDVEVYQKDYNQLWDIIG